MTIEKSKNTLEKSRRSELQLRIDVLEGIFKKSGNQLGILAGLANGTVDGWTDKQLDKSKPLVEKFLNFHLINPQWWETGKGDVFLHKPTSDQKATDNKEKMHNHEDVYRTIVEGHTEYMLVPREILKETQLVSTEQIKRTWEELAEKNKELAAKNQELERKNIQLDFYQNQFAKLLENLELSPKPPKPKEG